VTITLDGNIDAIRVWTNLQDERIAGFNVRTPNAEYQIGAAYTGKWELDYGELYGENLGVKGFFIDYVGEMLGLRIDNLNDPCVSCGSYMSGCLKCSSKTKCI
jgi:hypothetical protein